MSQEKKKEEDSPVLRIVLMHQYKDPRNTVKRAKKYLSKQPVINGNVMTNRKTRKSRKQRWEEKQQHGYFKRQTGLNAHEKSGT